MIAHTHPLVLTPEAYADLIRSPFSDETAGDAHHPVIVLAGSPDSELPSPGALPFVVMWVGSEFAGAGPQAADLVVGADDVDEAVAAIARAPLAARALAVHLRTVATVDVESGLAMESAVYSMLQSGPEFAAWRKAHPASTVDDTGTIVLMERRGDALVVTLDRPHRHNAISVRMRDELAQSLSVAVVDESISSVVLRGNGPSFCSGGDLDEFGSRPDPATAHMTRLARSPARLIHQLASRMIVQLHGAAFGGGIEIAAFAANVEAHPETRIALPEVGLGLIPGAGGTVSITRRIGRQRTAALALCGREIDATTAQKWGLVDQITEHPVSDTAGV
jgi:enoyl-CoA hydratase/carnithine racemase